MSDFASDFPILKHLLSQWCKASATIFSLECFFIPIDSLLEIINSLCFANCYWAWDPCIWYVMSWVSNVEDTSWRLLLVYHEYSWVFTSQYLRWYRSNGICSFKSMSPDHLSASFLIALHPLRWELRDIKLISCIGCNGVVGGAFFLQWLFSIRISRCNSQPSIHSTHNSQDSSLAGNFLFRNFVCCKDLLT